MSVTEYETTVLLRSDLGGDNIEGILEKIRQLMSQDDSSQLLDIQHVGRKKLAYMIQKQSRAYFISIKYLGAGNLTATLERMLRLSEHVLRYLTVVVARRVDVNKYQAKEYVAPDYSKVAPEPSEVHPAVAAAEETAEATPAMPEESDVAVESPATGSDADQDTSMQQDVQ